jgi:RecB family exonuclease
LPETFYLEGEIDALHTDGSEAWFIDYKTGGLVNKTQEDLQAKHGFQAQCYAYALLLSGFEKVKATFVRVEQPQSKQASSRSEGSSQDSNSEAGAEPQSITFTFSKDNLNTLREKIIQTYITSVEAHYLQ